MDICFRLDHRGNSFERTVFVIYARGRLKRLIRTNLIKSIDDRPCEQAECNQRAGKSFERHRSHRQATGPDRSSTDKNTPDVRTSVRRQRTQKKRFIILLHLSLIRANIDLNQ